MRYELNEYIPINDTPMKKGEEIFIARMIMKLLNDNKYDNLEDFSNKNNSLQEFLKKNGFENVVKHFGNKLNEEDYVLIIENLRTLTKNKSSYDEKDINTKKIDDKEYVSLITDDKAFAFDNSNSFHTIKEQLNHLQPTQKKFQTNDPEKNTLEMFKEMEKSKKESLNFLKLSEINYASLNEKEQTLYKIAYDYQLQNSAIIRVDLKNEVIINEDNEIIKIVEEDGKYKIKADNVDENYENDDNNIEKDSFQKQFSLKPNPDTIYSNMEE
ncbi:MAG: hypothetical protein Q4E75_06820 [bacterium]|nr:hypothetical protein [bacterium]